MVVWAAFVVRGILRGTIAQVFAFSGFVLGLFAAAAVADAVGGHWRGAEPRWIFLVLRWVVAVLAGLGVGALFRWWGDSLAEATHEGPFGWLDRVAGAAVGFALGALVCCSLVVLLLRFPGPGAVDLLSRGAATRPLLVVGERVTGAGRQFPGGLWLHEHLSAASRRLARRGQD